MAEIGIHLLGMICLLAGSTSETGLYQKLGQDSMKDHVVIIAIEAELHEASCGGGTFLAKEVNVYGSMRGGQDDSTRGRWFGAVDLAHGMEVGPEVPSPRPGTSQ